MAAPAAGLSLLSFVRLSNEKELLSSFGRGGHEGFDGLLHLVRLHDGHAVADIALFEVLDGRLGLIARVAVDDVRNSGRGDQG